MWAVAKLILKLDLTRKTIFFIQKLNISWRREGVRLINSGKKRSIYLEVLSGADRSGVLGDNHPPPLELDKCFVNNRNMLKMNNIFR